MGRYINAPETVIRTRAEGWADSTSASHGLTQAGEKIFFSPVPKFLYWGDSYADGVQVKSEQRAVNVFNAKAVDLGLRGVAVADSGLSMADFYFYIPRYEKLTTDVVGHVFLLAGMRSIIPGYHLDCHSQFLPDPWRFEASECPPSEVALEYASSINKWHVDFLHSIYKSLSEYSFRFSVGNLTAKEPIVEKVIPGLDSRQLEGAWIFMLDALEKKTKGNLTFVYAPLRPHLKDGVLVMGDNELEKKKIFQRLCRENGVGFIDLTQKFADMYELDGKLGQGFFNTPQGAGHLNVDGQALVGEGLYEYFSRGAQ
ncbi:MAG: hypothetical protein JEY79_07400 [Pseudodesulfovibrio sp.]|nr:hypothetical protein [Pseudodesulfovibrio sp.]